MFIFAAAAYKTANAASKLSKWCPGNFKTTFQQPVRGRAAGLRRVVERRLALYLRLLRYTCFARLRSYETVEDDIQIAKDRQHESEM